MSDEVVTKRILKFLRQMNADDDDAALLRDAVARAWLSADGRPTATGREMVRSFDDLERVSRQTQ